MININSNGYNVNHKTNEAWDEHEIQSNEEGLTDFTIYYQHFKRNKISIKNIVTYMENG